jgi:hypothetical protein
MKQAHELAATVGQPSTTRSADFERQHKRASRVWIRLAEMHGDRFLREYGEKPNRTWIEAIDRMSDEQVIAALRRLAEQNRAHPPTLPEFVSAGTTKPKNEFGLDYVPQVYRETRFERRLDAPRNDDAAREHLAAMRAALGRHA